LKLIKTGLTNACNNDVDKKVFKDHTASFKSDVLGCGVSCLISGRLPHPYNINS